MVHSAGTDMGLEPTYDGKVEPTMVKLVLAESAWWVAGG